MFVTWFESGFLLVDTRKGPSCWGTLSSCASAKWGVQLVSLAQPGHCRMGAELKPKLFCMGCAACSKRHSAQESL